MPNQNDPLEFMSRPKPPDRRRFSLGSLALLAAVLALALALGAQLSQQNAARPTSGPGARFLAGAF